MNALPFVIVTPDGITARRSAPLTQAAADALVAELDADPAFGHAWTTPAGNSPTLHYACALPVTAEGHDSLAADFVAATIGLALKEGDRYMWTYLGAGKWRVTNMNRMVRGFYSSWEVTAMTCNCPRFASAGWCKHSCSLTLSGFLIEGDDVTAYEPKAVSAATRAADWED